MAVFFTPDQNAVNFLLAIHFMRGEAPVITPVRKEAALHLPLQSSSRLPPCAKGMSPWWLLSRSVLIGDYLVFCPSSLLRLFSFADIRWMYWQRYMQVELFWPSQFFLWKWERMQKVSAVKIFQNMWIIWIVNNLSSRRALFNIKQVHFVILMDWFAIVQVGFG